VISSPLTGAPISPARYVVFDAPLGRAHEATGALIDFMVYLDTPLDVAMARRLLRTFDERVRFAVDHDLGPIRAELTSYLAYGRDAYLEMDRQIKPRCDLILDGLATIDWLAQQILEAVNGRWAGSTSSPA
jgi:uridine kinase